MDGGGFWAQTRRVPNIVLVARISELQFRMVVNLRMKLLVVFSLFGFIFNALFSTIAALKTILQCFAQIIEY